MAVVESVSRPGDRYSHECTVLSAAVGSTSVTRESFIVVLRPFPIMARTVTRRVFLGVSAAGITGCTRLTGQDTPTPAAGNPVFGDAEQMGGVELTSPAFDDGGPIPARYARDSQNVNPPLLIAGVPDGAESLALVVDDPDALDPAGKVWVHWVVWNISPTRTEIPEDWEPTDAVEGTNDFDTTGYGGPDPPDETHIYRFKLYALETVLEVSAGATKPELGRAMKGAVVAQTQLEGEYSP